MSVDPVRKNTYDSLFEDVKVRTGKKDKEGNWITRTIRKMVRTPNKCIVCGRPLKRNNSNQIVMYCSKMCKDSKNKHGRKKLAKLKVQVEQRRKRDEHKRRVDSEKRGSDVGNMSKVGSGS